MSSLVVVLAEQGGRLAVMSPEGDVFELMAGRYSGNNAPNFGVFLKGHAGDDLRVDRMGRPAEFVKNPTLTLGLTVQPGVLHGLADKPGFRDRGLLARFLYAVPESLVGRRDTNAPTMPQRVRESYARRLTQLLTLTADTTAEGKATPHVLRLDTGARVFAGWLAAHIEQELGEFGTLGSMLDWGGKLYGAVLRIAGLLHMAEYAETPMLYDTPVSRHTMEAAWHIGEYLKDHARAAFGQMGTDAAVGDAQALLRWLRHHCDTTEATHVTKREMHQGNRGRFKEVEAVDTPLAMLVDYGYLRRESPAATARQGGRPASPRYELNPLWRTQNPHNTQNPPQAIAAPTYHHFPTVA